METTTHIGITSPSGFRAAGGAYGLKPSGKPDLAVIVSDRPATAAGVFTSNKVKGEPLGVSRRHLRSGRAAAIVCNSGCANVATGEQGRADAQAMCDRVGQALGLPGRDVLVCSTGIIGRRLTMDRVLPGIDQVTEQLAQGAEADQAAARAILTTDKLTKHAGRVVTINERRYTLAGIAKGSGMIGPSLATMLAMITTDAPVAPTALKRVLKEAVAASFNRTSIDSDTSTSDSVLMLANGAAGGEPITESRQPGISASCRELSAALTDLCRDLAQQVVKDGEGVSKVIRLSITHAKSEADADHVGRSVVNSPLVKTAIHGSDPNWGRLVMAAGNTRGRLKPDSLSVRIGGLELFKAGQPTNLGLNPTHELARVMEQAQVPIEIDLGMGEASAQWLGCDLSPEYIRINADYTT